MVGEARPRSAAGSPHSAPFCLRLGLLPGALCSGFLRECSGHGLWERAACGSRALRFWGGVPKPPLESNGLWGIRGKGDRGPL